MNQIVPIVSARFAEVQQSERAALISLAMTQRRLSWRYRHWAAEDAASGNLTAYQKHAAEARRLWREALWHIDFARSKTHGA